MSESSDEGTWISWFCSLRGNEFLCEVDEDYICDKFNLTGLSELITNYRFALDVILDSDTEEVPDSMKPVVQNATEMLYGLIHARYILTNKGIEHMIMKYEQGDFGCCPRYLCKEQNMLPIGLHDMPEQSKVKTFCPACGEIYNPRLNRHYHLDGAYFGTTFPHMLFAVHPEIRPVQNTEKYSPKIYGYKLHHTAYQAQTRAYQETQRLIERTKKQARIEANMRALKAATADEPMK